MNSFSLFTKKEKKMEDLPSIHSLEFLSIQNQPVSLSQFKGKFILMVNVASKCGFTSQYEELEQLHRKYGESLVVIGFPCNQFGAQEPGTPDEIRSFCTINYGVSFLMAQKLDVKGDNQHPIYAWLTQKEKNGRMSYTVKWNFQKYLINPDGQLIDVFYSITKPLNTKITSHFEA